MTRPQAPPPQQASPPPQHPVADAAVIAAIIAALIAYSGSSDALYKALRGPLVRQGVKAQTVRLIAELAVTFPAPRLEGLGDAMRHVIGLNWERRAQFLLISAKRVDAAMTRARNAGEPVMAARRLALTAEYRYWKQTIAAGQARLQAAGVVDGAVTSYGPVLGWRAVKDSHVTPDCLAADGKNFRAAVPPLIGYPGTVHAQCRCYPVKPFHGARMLPSVKVA